jgi:hypothetical protein
MDQPPRQPVTSAGPPTAPLPPRTPTLYADDDADLEERIGAADVTLADLQPLRWGPIVAGTLTAVGLFVLLSLLAIAIGVQAAPGVEAVDDMDFVGIIVTSAIALGSFFVGGFVATWSSATSQTGRALINGFLVWTLWLVALAFLGAFGIGSIAGAAGELFGNLSVAAPDVEPEELMDVLETASWTSFLAMALTALAAMLGSMVATREELRGAWMRTFSRRIPS